MFLQVKTYFDSKLDVTDRFLSRLKTEGVFVTELSASEKNLIQIPSSLFAHAELLRHTPARVALISGVANLQDGINKKSKAGWLTYDNLTTV